MGSGGARAGMWRRACRRWLASLGEIEWTEGSPRNGILAAQNYIVIVWAPTRPVSERGRTGDPQGALHAILAPSRLTHGLLQLLARNPDDAPQH